MGSSPVGKRTDFGFWIKQRSSNEGAAPCPQRDERQRAEAQRTSPESALRVDGVQRKRLRRPLALEGVCQQHG